MEQQLYAIKITENIDAGSRNYESDLKVFPLSELKEGARLTLGTSWGQPNPNDSDGTVKIVWELTIDELTDDKLKFTFMDRHLTLNRYWQVLGTDSFDIPNAYIDVNIRFIFYFGTEQKSEESQLGRMQELYQQMYSNRGKGNFWKNTPLAREALHLMKDIAPEDDKRYFNEFCKLVVDETLLQFLDTPRLILSFMDFWHVLNESTFLWQDEVHRLLRFIDPDVTEDEKLEMIEEVRFLKYDPIQFSESWEEHIYEVELELEKQFKEEEREMMGFCFSYWLAKGDALAKRGIEWRSPQEMNPGTMFD